MITVIMESSFMILLMLIFRKFCRNVISMRIIYGLWLFVVLRMIPFELIGKGNGSLVMGLLSKMISLFPEYKHIYFDFAVVRIPWYFLVLWGVGMVALLLWEFFVNFKFEKFLFENRVRVEDVNCPYPVYSVADLQSSCIFKVKGQAGIYLQESILKKPEVYQTILSHEMCHMRARDLFWAKIRLLFVAIYWFNPMVWLAAYLSKEDCEMACDERTIALRNMKKSNYGKILLGEVNTTTLNAKEDIFSVATTMVSSEKGLRVRIEHLAARKHNKYMELAVGGLFVLCCTLLCFVGGNIFTDMNGEETIRQYVYYSNTNYQEGMKQLSQYDEWDYFFPNKLNGEILDIQKVDARQDPNNIQNEIYHVNMQVEYEGVVRQEKHVVSLVRQDGSWKIDWKCI